VHQLEIKVVFIIKSSIMCSILNNVKVTKPWRMEWKINITHEVKMMPVGKGGGERTIFFNFSGVTLEC